jgi:hypothetical protein
MARIVEDQCRRPSFGGCSSGAKAVHDASSARHTWIQTA